MSKITIKVKRKGHIYLIRCKGDPLYVGKTLNMEERWIDHKRDKRRVVWKHMTESGLNINDYDYEILETIPVVDKNDKKLCAAEGKHFHCFTEQGYQLINEKTPNNGGYDDKNSIAYANNLARQNRMLPCEFCGIIGRWGNRLRHQKTSYCLNHRRLNPT